MTGTQLHWVEGPWSGRLALSARPRGGDWLADEIAHWQCCGVDTVVSLLEAHEERDLDLSGEADATQAQGIRFLSFPIADREVPDSERSLSLTLDQLDRELVAGRNVLLHCRQGIGRTGLVAACLLLARGFDPQTAIERLSAARGVAIPETAEQRRWIERYAGAFVSPHDEQVSASQAFSLRSTPEHSQVGHLREDRLGRSQAFAPARSCALPQSAF